MDISENQLQEQSASSLSPNHENEQILNNQESWVARVFRLSVVTLPYGFYLNLLVIFIVVLVARRSLKQTYRSCIDPLTRGSLILVSVGMVMSAIAAIDKGEAALQLVNFLPFFWFFTILPFIVRSPITQYKLARDWALTSIPIHLVAIVEYLAKTERLPSFLYNWSFIQSWHSAPHIGRAMVMFDHPNVFANYAILTFGLSLGVILYASNTKILQRWLGLATTLSLISLFCSGSRNGILVAGSQLILLVLFTKLNRTILLLGGFSLAAFGISIAKWGLGNRSIGILQVMDDPRVGVWKIALDLIGERPWLGWGPGSFKFLYPSHLIDPTYKTVFHTHNLWLLLAVEYGIPVMIGLTITIGFICYRAVRSILTTSQATPLQSVLLIGYGLAFWGSIQFSMIDVIFYDARINVTIWILLSVFYTQSLGFGMHQDEITGCGGIRPSDLQPKLDPQLEQ